MAKRAVEVAGMSGADDDDAIAYAWTTEDPTPQVPHRRAVEVAGASGSDDDDAIAYPWTTEDPDVKTPGH
jgi:hypothetical protein